MILKKYEKIFSEQQYSPLNADMPALKIPK